VKKTLIFLFVFFLILPIFSVVYGVIFPINADNLEKVLSVNTSEGYEKIFSSKFKSETSYEVFESVGNDVGRIRVIRQVGDAGITVFINRYLDMAALKSINFCTVSEYNRHFEVRLTYRIVFFKAKVNGLSITENDC